MSDDPILKHTKEELATMVRKYQRRADRFESCFRRCAAQLWNSENPHPMPDEVDHITYLKAKIVDVEGERKQIIEQRDTHKKANRILRDQNDYLWKLVKTFEQDKTEQS